MQCHVKHETKPLEHMVYPDRLITIAILAFFPKKAGLCVRNHGHDESPRASGTATK
jgi:hypothetical protein